MSGHAYPRRISLACRRRATDRLLRRAARRVAARSAIALIDVVADALEHGHVGAARDLLEIVVRDHALEEIVSELLGLDAPTTAPAKEMTR